MSAETRIDRRTTIKWVLAAAGLMRTLGAAPLGSALAAPARDGTGYGTDPDLFREYHPGELWPLTLTEASRHMVSQLCDLIVPADEHSPSASAVGLVDFIDEWISAPYPEQRTDRALVLDGLAWLEREAQARHRLPYTQLSSAQQQAICDDICFVPKAAPEFLQGAVFFTRFRELTLDGFYTSPEGRKDLQYVGNVPLARYDGPPLEVLKKAGLA